MKYFKKMIAFVANQGRDRPSHTRKKQGFTLIEITLVTAMVGTLFAMLFGTYFQMLSVVDNQTATSNRSQTAIEAMNMMSADLNNIVIDSWYSPAATYDKARAMFKAEKDIQLSKRIDKINFITGKYYSNALTLQAQVHHVTYIGKISALDSKVHLVRRENAFADYEKPSEGLSVLVFDDVEQFKIEFSSNGENWFDQYDITLQKVFPKFISITLEYKDGDTLKSIRRIVTPPISWL